MSRTRDNSQILGPFVGQHGGWHPSTGWTGTPAQHLVSVVAHDVMTDVVTKRFKETSAKGGVVNNPMSKHKCAPSFKGGTYAVFSTRPGSKSGYRRETTWGAECASQVTDADLSAKTSRLETLAITEAYSKVGEMDLEGLVSLAEARETAAFLAAPIGKMRSLTNRWNRASQLFADDLVSYQARLDKWNKLPPRVQARRKPPVLRKRKIRIGRVSVTDISSLWLAYRYGLMPLIYDVQGIISLIQRKYGEVRLTARAKQSTSWVDETRPRAGPYGWNDSYEYHFRTEYSAEVRAGVLYAAKTNFASAAGLTIDRVPGALWELVPLSFVVDWFVNIGDVLNALTASARGEILASWCTVKVTYKREHRLVSCTTTGDFAAQVTNYPSYTETGEFKRRYPTSLQDIGVRGQFDLNLKRWVDAFALIHQSLAKNSKILSAKLDFSRSTRPRKP